MHHDLFQMSFAECLILGVILNLKTIFALEGSQFEGCDFTEQLALFFCVHLLFLTLRVWNLLDLRDFF